MPVTMGLTTGITEAIDPNDAGMWRRLSLAPCACKVINKEQVLKIVPSGSLFQKFVIFCTTCAMICNPISAKTGLNLILVFFQFIQKGNGL